MTTARALMERFVERTTRSKRRYLWTDAFAVGNLLTLGEMAGACQLADLVHGQLGRHRGDDGRTGWISGLSEDQGALHPTRGGLRIGKPLPERRPGEPFDDRLEWERDGQYFHYLTKWMIALDQLARAISDTRYTTWARELATTAFEHFAYTAPGGRRMYWKMSIDLSRALVESMGQHDPVDGYVTCLQLASSGSELADVIAGLRSMIDPAALATADPLGLGGLFTDAATLDQLGRDAPLRDALLEGARIGLPRWLGSGDLEAPATRRLAFRELGLAIGLAAVEKLDVAWLARYSNVAARIRDFWSLPAHRETRLYREHEDINDAMLATSLAPPA